MNFLSKYPLTKNLLEETGMTLDQALIWTECELEKVREGEHGSKRSVHS